MFRKKTAIRPRIDVKVDEKDREKFNPDPIKKVELKKRQFSLRQRVFRFVDFIKNSKFLLIVFFVVILPLLILAYTQYRVATFRLNDLKYIDKKELEVHINEYLSKSSFFHLNNEELISTLKSKNKLIDDVYINKSLFAGVIIDVKEHEPKAVLNIEKDKKYIFTSDDQLIDFVEINKPVITFNFQTAFIDEEMKRIWFEYESDKDKSVKIEDYNIEKFNSTFFQNKKFNQKYAGITSSSQLSEFLLRDFVENYISTFVHRAITFVQGVNKLGFTGQYAFDNYGNLSILSSGDKVIRADLKERYFTIDEQLKVFQNALSKTSFKEIDLRFNYLIVKE